VSSTDRNGEDCLLALDQSPQRQAPVMCVVGARPNFMKMAPILRALAAHQPPLPAMLVHTGQHYDQAMSGEFFAQLGIPAPHVNLEAGSGTQAEQTASIMVKYEQLLLQQPADLCLGGGGGDAVLPILPWPAW